MRIFLYLYQSLNEKSRKLNKIWILIHSCMKLLSKGKNLMRKSRFRFKVSCSISSASLTDGWIDRLIIPLIRKTFNPERFRRCSFNDVSETTTWSWLHCQNLNLFPRSYTLTMNLRNKGCCVSSTWKFEKYGIFRWTCVLKDFWLEDHFDLPTSYCPFHVLWWLKLNQSL